MPRHFFEFIVTHSSPGVLLVPQHLRVAEAIDCLLLIWGASEMDEWAHRMCLVPSLATCLVSGRR